MAKDNDASGSRSGLRGATRLAQRPIANIPPRRPWVSSRKAASQAGARLTTVAPRCRWSHRPKAVLASAAGRSSALGRSTVIEVGPRLGSGGPGPTPRLRELLSMPHPSPIPRRRWGLSNFRLQPTCRRPTRAWYAAGPWAACGTRLNQQLGERWRVPVSPFSVVRIHEPIHTRG